MLSSDTADTVPTQRDRHIRMIVEKGRLGWQKIVDYGKRSLAEVAMLRYKVLIGRSLRARALPAQKVEARVACKVNQRRRHLLERCHARRSLVKGRGRICRWVEASAPPDQAAAAV
jgi:hypothetical protein